MLLTPKRCASAGASSIFTFGEAYAGLELLRRARERWRHRAARRAPFGPEIDQQRHIASFRMDRETCAIQRERCSFEERMMTLATLPARGQFRGGNAVDRIALRADDMKGIVHRSAPCLCIWALRW